MSKTGKITFEKHFLIAEKMRETKNYALNLIDYDPEDVLVICHLIKSDGIFNFVKETKDIDIRKLEAIMKYLDAEEKMKEATAKF